jgi:hypothetical protein
MQKSKSLPLLSVRIDLDPEGRIAHYTFWVSDPATSKTLHGPVRSSGPQHGFALGPGKYTIHLRVEDEAGLKSTDSEDIEISPKDVVVSEHGTPCSLGSDGQFSCTMLVLR